MRLAGFQPLTWSDGLRISKGGGHLLYRPGRSRAARRSPLHLPETPDTASP